MNNPTTPNQMTYNQQESVCPHYQTNTIKLDSENNTVEAQINNSVLHTLVGGFLVITGGAALLYAKNQWDQKQT